MGATQPFTPDALYCVYCHAPAAGPCAVCGALCCADCVELVMGLTVRRAICRSCLERGHRPAGASGRRWLLLAAAAVVGIGVLCLVYLT